MRPLVWKAQSEPIEHAISILAPCGGDSRCRNGVFEDEVPTDDPGNEFPHGGIGIGVGAAGNRNHRGELRVTETRKGAADAGNDERKDNRWTRTVGNRSSGAHEKTRADDSPNSQGN